MLSTTLQALHEQHPEVKVFSSSPLARPDECDEERIHRILTEGSALECLIEANFWLGFSSEHTEGIDEEAECVDKDDEEPKSTAQALVARAIQLLAGPAYASET